MRLEVRGLRICLQKTEILRDVSFCCGPGLTAVLGVNGAGKTTLLKSLAGICPLLQGEIWLEDGKSLALHEMSAGRRARYLSYVPQESRTGLHCPVREFVVMGRNPYLNWLDTPRKSDYQKADEAMESLHIRHLSEAYFDEISGGERRLAYLARARVQEARWMVLDEPLANLDFGRQHRFLVRLNRYLRTEGTGAILSVHDPLLAYEYAEQILVLKEGKLAASLSKKDWDFEETYLSWLRQLYGMDGRVYETPEGKTIVWRRQDAKN